MAPLSDEGDYKLIGYKHRVTKEWRPDRWGAPEISLLHPSKTLEGASNEEYEAVEIEIREKHQDQ